VALGLLGGPLTYFLTSWRIQSRRFPLNIMKGRSECQDPVLGRATHKTEHVLKKSQDIASFSRHNYVLQGTQGLSNVTLVTVRIVAWLRRDSHMMRRETFSAFRRSCLVSACGWLVSPSWGHKRVLSGRWSKPRNEQRTTANNDDISVEK
jgi:hypothetical protein